MLSCDTFALGKKYYIENKNCLGKNSDRPLGEAQPIAFYPGGKHPAGEMLKCTHLTIPQAAHTYTVLGCRPYWIWGFEMGVNEMGLAIGNEAEWSRSDAETEEGLLGMDLLRLALERAATAEAGVRVIAELLEKYGQNANANPLFDRRYENSFLLVDRDEIWLMETAGRRWIAKKIGDWAAISNCYSIGGEYDMASPDIETYAREKRWLRPDEAFDFAKAYSRSGRQSTALHRYRRQKKLIAAHAGPLDRAAMTGILRDHFEGEIIEPRWDACAAMFPSICMHAAEWNGSQTAASIVCAWDDELGPVTWYAPSLPCLSLYIPVYWTGDTPAAMGKGEGTYDENSLWWQTQRLAMLVSADESRFGGSVRAELRKLEGEITAGAEEAEQQARQLIRVGSRTTACELLAAYTRAASDSAMGLVRRLCESVSSEIRKDGGLYGTRKEFLEDYCARVGMPL